MTYYKKITSGTAAFTLLTALFIFVAPTEAQQTGLALNRVEGPQLMITWKTNTYAPSWFKGKALPTANSPITASVELIDGGNRVDLSSQEVRWYMNDDLVARGLGLQNVSFNATGFAENTIALRVEIPSYQSQSGTVLKTIEIPVVEPQTVIESPFPGGKFSSTPIELKGWPFFFNVKKSSQLNFSWSVNGGSSENLENPEILSFDLNSDAPSGSSVNISLAVGTPGSVSNIATAGTNLTLVK